MGVVCAETDAEAERLASSGKLAMMRFLQGTRDRPLPTVEEALAHCYDADEAALQTGRESHVIVGSPARVHDRLMALVEEGRADEVMILTHVHAHEARRRSYELVAGAFAAAR